MKDRDTTVEVSPFHWRRLHPFAWPRLSIASLGVLFVVIVILISTLGPKEQKDSLKLASFDLEVISPDTTWYRAVNTETQEGAGVTAYRFPAVPEISSNKTHKMQSLRINVAARAYEYWAYKLGVKSTVKVTYMLNGNATFVAIRGLDDLNRFLEDPATPVLYSHIGAYGSWSYAVVEKDEYFFLWESVSVAVNGTASLNLSLSTYDLSSPTETCLSASCSFDLSSGSDDVVVLSTQDLPNSELANVDYSIQPRLSVYWGILGTFIAVLAITFMCLCSLIWRKSKQFKPASSFPTEKKPLLGAATRGRV